MKLSAPIYRLKRRARLKSREQGIPHTTALDAVAREEGFASWSLLAREAGTAHPVKRLGASLEPGELLLLGARPGHGKTLLSLELAIDAMKAGRHSAFFTLEYTATEIAERFSAVGERAADYDGRFYFDNSDEISAAYIIDRLADAASGTLVVVDYLQLLDQKREHPPLAAQIKDLRAFARARGLTVVLLSQIHRSYDPAQHPVPRLEDVRLPNPLDLSLFDKTCFLNDGELEFAPV